MSNEKSVICEICNRALKAEGVRTDVCTEWCGEEGEECEGSGCDRNTTNKGI
jgi:hypothetical protein